MNLKRFFFFEAAASNSVHLVIFEDWILCAFGIDACCEMPSLPLWYNGLTDQGVRATLRGKRHLQVLNEFSNRVVVFPSGFQTTIKMHKSIKTWKETVIIWFSFIDKCAKSISLTGYTWTEKGKSWKMTETCTEIKASYCPCLKEFVRKEAAHALQHFCHLCLTAPWNLSSSLPFTFQIPPFCPQWANQKRSVH